MSQENVELLRKGIDAWNRREVDLWLAYATPDIEWMPAGPAAVERTIYRGYDEVRDGITAAWEVWDVFEFQEDQVRDLGSSTLWLGRVKMRGSTSGVELDQEFATHSVAHDGKIALIHTFLSWREGLAAAGLSE
jgi:ketosteroid isomerase-like protein